MGKKKASLFNMLLALLIYIVMYTSLKYHL